MVESYLLSRSLDACAGARFDYDASEKIRFTVYNELNHCFRRIDELRPSLASPSQLMLRERLTCLAIGTGGSDIVRVRDDLSL